MPYMIIMTDKPDAGDLRAKTRDIHLKYLDDNKHMLLGAGALTGDDGVGGNGSLYLVDTNDRQVAEAFLKGDPFDQVGLFSKVEIRRWRYAFFNKQRLV